MTRLKARRTIRLVTCLAAGATLVSAVVLGAERPAPLRPAFPGAEGFGRMSQGGRGGRIIAVTTLADAGPGSLRACIDAAGPRVCIFRVGGVIRYTTMRPDIRNPYLTIAGETAPGGGILITHAGGKGAFTPFVIKNTHDVIVRDIRVRLDRFGEQRRADSAFIIESSRNVILDHVSGSWARDENFGGYAGNDAITVSWSIFAEGVPRHDKCALLSSDPTGPQRLSFLHNLCAHNGDRNPDVNFPPGSCVEVVNNVLYNAQVQFTEIWESYGGTPVNLVGNYYRRGPNTPRLAFGIDRPLVASTGPARIYSHDNVVDGKGIIIAPAAREALVPAPVCPLTVKPRPGKNTYAAVLAGAGAFPRDQVDARIVGEVRARTGAIGRPNRVLPPIANGTPYKDSDGDGMSDRWEMANGCDPRRNDAWQDANGNGWANLEEFLHYAHNQRMAGRQPL
ncbi:pectate lyase [Sphingomonas sp. JC676]|uniref:pectate lyase n=1 Tax=Sphingomonas sp. JC676 TaxID=2768065 RepID=UPI00223C3AA7|nr:pectate lyase [Sphingomonas sp. JC676]